MKKKLLAGLLSAVMLVTSFTSPAYAGTTGDGHYDSFASAYAIKRNETVTHKLGTSEDENYYKFTFATNGVVKFEINKHTANEECGWGWKLEIYDENCDYMMGCDGIKSKYELPAAAFKKGSTIYLKIKNSMPYYSTINAEYDLTAKYDTGKNWEAEKNNDRASANSLSIGKTICGTIYKGNDVDCYKVKASSSGKLAVSLASNINNNPQWVGQGGWAMTVCDSKGNRVGFKNFITGENTIVLDVKKGTYYISVSAVTIHGEFEKAVYELTVDAVTPFKAKDVKVSATKGKKAKVNWKAINKINGYEVRWAKKSSMSGAKVAKVAKSKTSYTIKGLKAKTTYYVQVRAYKKLADGSKLYGNWSAKKKVTAKK